MRQLTGFQTIFFHFGDDDLIDPGDLAFVVPTEEIKENGVQGHSLGGGVWEYCPGPTAFERADGRLPGNMVPELNQREFNFEIIDNRLQPAEAWVVSR